MVAIVVAGEEAKLGFVVPLLKSNRPAAVANSKPAVSESGDEAGYHARGTSPTSASSLPGGSTHKSSEYK
jgi:hypothetical protein